MALVNFDQVYQTLTIDLTVSDNKNLLNGKNIISRYNNSNLEFRLSNLDFKYPCFDLDLGSRVFLIPREILIELDLKRSLEGIYIIDRRTCEKGFYELNLI